MSSFKKQEEYIPEKCTCCGQSMTYLIPVDRGSVDILKAVARAIQKKGINAIHPRKEIEISEAQRNQMGYELMIKSGNLTSNMVGNLSRPRFHGLIARIKREPGNYCLTSKGAKFLKGDSIPRYAIVDKTTGHQVGYWMSDKYEVNIKEFSTDEELWEGIDYDIVEGQVIRRIEKDPETQRQLFVK